MPPSDDEVRGFMRQYFRELRTHPPHDVGTHFDQSR